MLKKLANARMSALRDEMRPLKARRKSLDDDQQDRLVDLERSYHRWALISGY